MRTRARSLRKSLVCPNNDFLVELAWVPNKTQSGIYLKLYFEFVFETPSSLPPSPPFSSNQVLWRSDNSHVSPSHGLFCTVAHTGVSPIHANPCQCSSLGRRCGLKRKIRNQQKVYTGCIGRMVCRLAKSRHFHPKTALRSHLSNLNGSWMTQA